MTLRDFEEVGRFASFLRGEPAPRGRIRRALRRARWLLAGLHFWWQVKIKGA